MSRTPRSLVGSSKHLNAFVRHLCSTADGAGQDPHVVVIADVNLSSRHRYQDWHCALRAAQIDPTHVPQPGSPEDPGLPPGIDTGKREYRVATYELRGTARSLAALVERFSREGTLLDAWLRNDAHLPGRGLGQVSRAAAEAVVRRQRKAKAREIARRGDEAAAEPVFDSDEEE